MQGKNNGERKNKVKKTEDSSCSLLLHFWITSRSPFSKFYIPFQSSGSQQSNASNGVQFRVETKKLQPLQVNHSKLKEAFCKVLRNHPFVTKWFRSLFVQCDVSPFDDARFMPRKGSWEPQGGSQLRSPVKIAWCCEIISQPSWVSAKSRRHHFSPAKWFLKPPDICYRHWEIFSIRFLLSKSQNTPCKPPITWFLSF